MLSDPALDDLLGQLGVVGPYQLKQHGLHLLTAILAGLHMLSLTFIAPTPNHRCFIKELDQNISFQEDYVFNSSVLSQYIPQRLDGTIDHCNKFDNAFSIDDDNNVISSCGGNFIYDKSNYPQSRVYEWNMVCDKKWQRALIQSIYVFGVFNGAVVSGALSDRFGRKRILCISALFQFIFAMASGFITNYVIYSINLFFYGFFGSGGAFITGFVLSMELVNRKNRTFIGCAFSACFAIGICLNALWGYLIRDITLLQIVFACHAFLLFGHFWLIDESIRWLWGQGRYEDAIEIVRKACKVNGSEFRRDSDNLLRASIQFKEAEAEATASLKSYGLSDLFKMPRMRNRALCTTFIWFSLALCFYGLAFNTGTLPGNPYIVFFLLSVVDLPGHFIVTVIVDKTGRRSLNALLLFIGGVSCVSCAFIPRGLTVTTLAVIAKIALAGCFAVMYNYTAELFPTVVRNSAVGLCSMASRMGGMLTPQIILLDTLDRRIPTVVFGIFALLAALLTLFVPETLNKEMPQSLEDGEKFGQGDTAFSSFAKSRKKATFIVGSRLDEYMAPSKTEHSDPEAEKLKP